LQTLKDDLNAKSRDFFPYPGGFTQRNERSPYRQTAAKKENINTVRITPFTCLLLSSSLNLSPLETGVVTVLAPGDCKGSLTGNNGYPSPEDALLLVRRSLAQVPESGTQVNGHRLVIS